MRFTTCLLAAALVLAAFTVPAHADTYEFIVSNFDGYGSSATFDLPSSIPNIYQVHGDLFTAGAVVNFIFEPGATVPAPFFGLRDNSFIATSEVYESQSLAIGFTDRDDAFPDFAVGGVTVSPPDYMFYAPVTVFTGRTPVLFTTTNGSATFTLGTFPSGFAARSSFGDGSVTIVNATPEPSTFVLFGTGILGLAGVARRKFLS